MKSFTFVALIISFVSFSVLADQTSCEVSQKSLLSDDLLKKLTVKVCPPENTQDPDVNMEYDKQLQSSKAADFLVYQYTDKCYGKINRELFKTADQDADTLKLAQQLDAVLCDYPKHEVEVFRGANLPEAVSEKYLKADEITFQAFTSTSTAFNVACEFAKKNGNSFFKIISKSGRLIENKSKHELEAEVLFRTNARFKVITAVSGFHASIMASCKGVSNYFELEEIYDEEPMKPFVWPMN